MNKFLLRTIGWTAAWWRWLGADPDQLRIILETKLKMDSRRRSAFGMMGNQKKGKEKKSQDAITVGVFALMGVGLMLAPMFIPHTATGYFMYFSVWMIFLSLTLITDFTDVLIDVRDNYILLPRPVNDRTMTLSRLLHIFLYLSKLVLGFAIPGLIGLTIKFGWPVLILFPIMVSISVVLSIFFVNLVYLAILRFLSPKKFKEAISYIQIIFTSSILIGYYIFPQLIQFLDLKTFNIFEYPLAWFLPSTWIAALWEIFIHAKFTTSLIVMGVLALLSPFISFYLVSNYLAKNFNQKMLGIGQAGSEDDEQKTVKTENSQQKSWRVRSANLVAKHPIERACYEWAWAMMQRSRTFRVKLYPMFAFIPAYFVYLMVMGDGDIREKVQSALASDSYIILLYCCFIVLSAATSNARFTEQFKAAWVFFAKPIERPGPIITGASKAALMRYYLPYYLMVSIAVLSCWGIDTLDDIVLVFFINILLSFLATLIAYRNLPFSIAWENAQKANNTVNALLTMVLAGGVGSLHYFVLTKTWWLIPIALLTTIGLTWLVYKELIKLNWQDLREV